MDNKNGRRIKNNASAVLLLYVHFLAEFRKLVKCYHHVVVIYLIKILSIIVFDVIRMPDHKPRPYAAVLYEFVYARNVASFVECHGLVCVKSVKPFPCFQIGRIVVGVGAYDVAVFVAYIPACFDIAAVSQYPD